MIAKDTISGKTVFIIDPVGIKAGLDHYNDSLAMNWSELGTKAIVYSNYDSHYSTKIFPFSFSSSIFYVPGMLFAFLRSFLEIKKYRPEFVLIHLFKATKFTLWFLKRIKKFRSKLIVIVHDIESLVSEKNNQNTMSELLTESNNIVVHNQFSKDELLKKYSSTENKVTVIAHGDYRSLPSGIDKEESRSLLGLKNDLPVVLFFGMIKPSKGLDTLLKAMQTVKARLVIAGRTRNCSIADYASLLEPLNVSDRVLMDINYISNEKRDLYFSAADVIVLPYKKIYQSGVLVMALSYQLPVLASDLEPNKDFVKQLKTIELFSVGNSTELSTSLNKLLGSENERSGLTKNGILLLERNHNWKVIAKQFNELINL